MKLQECLTSRTLNYFASVNFYISVTYTNLSHTRKKTCDQPGQMLLFEATYKKLNSSMNGAIITFYILSFYKALIARARRILSFYLI